MFGIVAWLLLITARGDAPTRERGAASTAPAATESVAGVRLCVEVVSEHRRALAGTGVRAVREEAERRFTPFREGTTDDAGRVCFEGLPRGSFWVIAEGKGHARASRAVSVAEDVTETLVLEAEHTLGVSVEDDLGKPVPLATVLVTSSDALPHGARTDGAGRARIARLPRGPFAVEASAEGYEPAAAFDVTDEVRLVLRRLSAIDVHVVDAASQAVPKATVLIAGSGLWPARRAVTDDSGKARILGLAQGTYDLRATEGTRVSDTLYGFVLGRGVRESVTLKLVPGRMVTALVTDGDRDDAPPVAEADVLLVEDGIASFPLHGRTNRTGTVTLGPVGHGAATLTARAREFVGGPLVPVPSTLTGPVRIPLVRGAAVHGEVVDARGFPIAGASIEIVGTDRQGLPIAETPAAQSFRAAHFEWSLQGPPPLIPAGELGVMPGPVPPIPRAGAAFEGRLPVPMVGGASAWITNTEGAFTARPIPPGRVRALVRHPEYVEAASELVSVTPGGEARVKVVLSKGGAVSGRVVDARGFPVEGAVVFLAAERGTFARELRTERDGTFWFEGVPRSVVLGAARPEAPRRRVLRQVFAVPDGERVEREVVLPEPREAVRIRVVDAQGTPIELAEVRSLSLSPEAPLRITRFTDATGAVEVEDAAGLPLRIRVDAPRFAPIEHEIEAAPSELTLTLDPGVLVTGRVTAVRGRRYVANAVVTLEAGVHRRSTTTSEEGEFRFPGVPAGSVRFRVSHPDYAEAVGTVAVTSTGRVDRPFELPAIDLEEPGIVEGTVLDANGEPVSGARVGPGVVPVYLPQGSLPPGLAVSDASGAFVLRGLRSGSLELSAYASGVGRGAVGGVAVEAGRTTSGVVIRLTELVEAEETFAAGGLAVTLGERRSGGALEIVIVQVAASSEAERSGLRAGDVITAIDGRRPSSLADARAAFAGPLGSDVVIELRRDGAPMRLRVPREPVRR